MVYVNAIKILFISKEFWENFLKLIQCVMTLYEIPQYIFPPPKYILGTQHAGVPIHQCF